MDEVVRLAIEAAKKKLPEGAWEHLSPDERTTAIYREMRRIDAERTYQDKSNTAE
ncbi:MAG: hypothetical protein JO270_18850 [Acidobacteriaceae bacterium]|nr:hypothetical protein [Acidobacteriaceae bacterium]